MVERVEEPGPADVRKTKYGQRAQMAAAQPRLEPADKRRVGEQSIEVDRRLRDDHLMAARRDGVVKLGERFSRIQRAHVRRERGEQVEDRKSGVEGKRVSV